MGNRQTDRKKKKTKKRVRNKQEDRKKKETKRTIK